MKLSLKLRNQNLAVTLVKPGKKFKGPLPALIFIHGWKSNQEGNIKRAKEISKLGFICLTLDLRGHGESGEPIEQYSREDHLEDIKTAYEYLTHFKEVNPEKIGIIGSSYGAYLSAVATNYLNFEWLILRVPALYFDDGFSTPTAELIRKDKDAFTTSGLTPKNSLALKGVANFLGEILIIESEKDKVIPHEVIENYLNDVKDKQRLTYALMKDTAHSLDTRKQEEEYIDIMRMWLSENSDNLKVDI